MNVWDDLAQSVTAFPGNMEALAQAFREMAKPPGWNQSCVGDVYIMTGECHSIEATKVYHADGTIEYQEPALAGQNY